MSEETPNWRPLADGPFSPTVAWLFRLCGVVGYAVAVAYFVVDFEAPLVLVVVGLPAVGGLLALLPSLLDLFEQTREAEE
jgi:hypothetical protein